MSNGNESFKGVSHHVEATKIHSNKIAVTSVNAKSTKTADLTVGARGTKINKILTGTLSVNPPSIAATTRATVSVALAGLTADCRVILEPPSSLNAGLLYCGHENATNQINIFLYNKTGGNIDDVATIWKYVILDMDGPI